jgi:hypothetical protein
MLIEQKAILRIFSHWIVLAYQECFLFHTVYLYGFTFKQSSNHSPLNNVCNMCSWAKNFVTKFRTGISTIHIIKLRRVDPLFFVCWLRF